MQPRIPANDAMSKRPWSLALITLGIAILTIHSLGSGHADNIATEAPPGASAPQVLKFAMMADSLRGVNSNDAITAIKFNWMNHLKEVFSGFDPQFEILPDVASAAQRIRNNRLHGLCMGIAQYLSLREQVNLKPVFISSSSIRSLES